MIVKACNDSDRTVPKNLCDHKKPRQQLTHAIVTVSFPGSLVIIRVNNKEVCQMLKVALVQVLVTSHQLII